MATHFKHLIKTFLMKYLLSSPDSAQTGLAQGLLEAAGIECEVRNEALSQAVPGLTFITELWILHDEDYEEARSLIQLEGPVPKQPR
jgi:hypothetical protein